LSGKRILCVVTGGIAAYKSALLVRLLTCAGASVRVVMSRAAAEFVTPLTFETLSGNPVHTDLFARRDRPSIQHVELSEWADRVVVAPATADILAKAALGVADDVASTVLLAARAPVLFAPAMNDAMWNAPATARNVERLRADGRIVLEAGSGALACGSVGPGRMMEPDEIARRIEESFAPGDLAGTTVLVTAGRTEEAVDPVRYLTNRSSGRMGFAVAREARARGTRVILVHGAVDVPVPAADETVRVSDAAGMKRAVAKAFGSCDVCVMAAAVSDFTPARTAASKIKRSKTGLAIELRPTEDILRSLAKRKGGRIVVGFALETENGEANARRKARDKGCDYMVLNEPGPGTGFGSETNRVTVFKGTARLFATPVVSKEEAARRIVDTLVRDRRLGKRRR